ncbi:MAG: CpaF family protein [Acidimicrobiales bacterium]|nr:CpaF family protein [Acidimicrobiales bacterium]
MRRRLLDSGVDLSAVPAFEALARSAVREVAPLLGGPDLDRAVQRIVADVVGFGPLDELLASAAITEVMVNGPGPVWVEVEGRLRRTDVVIERRQIDWLIERIVAPLGRRVDLTSPVVDARLPDGSRVNVVVPPLAVDGPYVTVRRFGATDVPLDAFCCPEVASLLARAVRERANLIVSGGTGAGKTTLLNALAAHIDRGERVVTVEDAAELRLPGDHVVRLEARPSSVDGIGEVRIRDLVRNALRMRPDRIIVGECRGPEALDVLWAMNTGHEGSLSTCHANGCADALRRLEAMVLMDAAHWPLRAVREHVDAAVDLVVHVERHASGERRIAAVAQVTGATPRLRPVATASTVHHRPSAWRGQGS